MVEFVLILILILLCSSVHGSSFSVFAPNAVSASAVSDRWKVSLSRDASGVWRGATNLSQPGDLYQIVLGTLHNGTLSRLDPSCTGRSGNFSVIATPFQWKSPANFSRSSTNVVVYELHVPSFSEAGTFDGVRAKLPYLQNLGVTMIELMPVADFGGASGGGWGYNPTGLFNAVSESMGGAAGLQRLVDAAHSLGIGVVLDVVYNHCDSAAHNNALIAYDGFRGQSGNGVYFYQSSDLAMTYWGPRPDYSQPAVVAFLRETLRVFVTDFRIDGFRFDATVCIRKPGKSCWTNPNVNQDGRKFLQNANVLLAQYWTTAEDDQGDQNITKPVSSGGLGFDSQWAYQGTDHTNNFVCPPNAQHADFYYAFVEQLTRATNANTNVTQIAALLTGSTEGRRVLFTENHDQASNQNRGRIPKIVDPNGSENAPSYWAAKKAMMGLACIVLGDGTPMLFQGQEFLTYDAFLFPVPPKLNWRLAFQNAGLVAEVAALLRLPRGPGGPRSVLLAPSQNALCLARAALLCCLNFAAAQSLSLRNVSVPDGRWTAVFNGDDAAYFPAYQGLGDRHLTFRGGAATVFLPQYSAVCYSQ